MQTLQPQTTLQGGKYRIISVLGQGGFGITYLAEQTMLERRVAIKEFFMREFCGRDESTSHVTLGTDGGRETVTRFREKFLKEARNIAKLNHPNIVKIIDVSEENGTAYYVMEYAEGGSLADKVKREGYLSEPVATRYILQVAEALAYVHARKMNHLDVKPANIMLTGTDTAVLIDFGLSKQYNVGGQQTSTTPVGISEGYAPMEQYKQGGVGDFSPETDIYALGATFFKMLTGTTPPCASDVNEEGVPVDELKAKGVSEKAIEVICEAMKPRKKERPKNVTVILDLLNSKQSLTPPPPPLSFNNVSWNGDETHVLQAKPQESAVLNGYHKKRFEDGSMYEGDFVNDKPQGWGTMIYVGGASYTGEWHYGQQEGQGTWNYPDGGSYVGEWQRGRRHGMGKLIKKDGTVIVGEWKDDRMVSETETNTKDTIDNGKETIVFSEVERCLNKISKSLKTFWWVIVMLLVFLGFIVALIVPNIHEVKDSVKLDFVDNQPSGRILVQESPIKTEYHQWGIVYIQCITNHTIIRKEVIPFASWTQIYSDRNEYIEDADTKTKYYIQESDVGFGDNLLPLYYISGKKARYFNEIYPALPMSVKRVNIFNGASQYYVKNLSINRNLN